MVFTCLLRLENFTFYIHRNFFYYRLSTLCRFYYISNKMQRYTVYLYLETAVHVSGCTSTHHQEHIQLYLQHAVDTVVYAPDDGWRYSPKHVEQFLDINKLCNVASCWIYSRIYLRCTGGTRWRSWLRHCATSRKVAGSILDGIIGIFH